MNLVKDFWFVSIALAAFICVPTITVASENLSIWHTHVHSQENYSAQFDNYLQFSEHGEFIPHSYENALVSLYYAFQSDFEEPLSAVPYFPTALNAEELAQFRYLGQQNLENFSYKIRSPIEASVYAFAIGVDSVGGIFVSQVLTLNFWNPTLKIEDFIQPLDENPDIASFSSVAWDGKSSIYPIGGDAEVVSGQIQTVKPFFALRWEASELKNGTKVSLSLDGEGYCKIESDQIIDHHSKCSVPLDGANQFYYRIHFDYPTSLDQLKIYASEIKTLPSRLTVSGPESAEADECAGPFYAVSSNAISQAIPISETRDLHIDIQGYDTVSLFSGNIYSDATCSVASQSTQIHAGESSAEFYVKGFLSGYTMRISAGDLMPVYAGGLVAGSADIDIY